MVETVIFDIDGTLADITHRLHHVKNGKRNWDQFFAEAGADTVIESIKKLNHMCSEDYKIILVSGRDEKINDLTQNWLQDNDIRYDELHMRPTGDYRKDFIIKSEILDDILERDHEIVFVVDDRPSVVKMWRDRGLTCLQCSEWNETPGLVKPKGLLTIMVGPSGAGKSTFLEFGVKLEDGTQIHPSHIVSSDQIRADLCGDFRDQTKNDEVFSALHRIVKVRVDNGLPTTVDATNIKRKDRMEMAALAQGHSVRYIVVDRPLTEKYRDAGWRSELKFDLIKKHDDTFKSQLKDILAGDGLPNVVVLDMREP